jgi:signal transduction histidine kinase
VTGALRALTAQPRPPHAPGPNRRDAALVAVVVLAVVLEGVLRTDVLWRPIAVAFAIVLAAALPWRRVRPLAVVSLTFGASIVLNVAALALGARSVGLGAMVYVLVVVYALYRWGAGREILLGSAVVVAAVVLGIARDRTPLAEVPAAVLVATLPAVLGAAVRSADRSRRRGLEHVRTREREQLARELHDTVAHHVSAMVVRAQAGQLVAAAEPAAAIEALEVIEAEGARALAEMRSLVGVLRQSGSVPLAPIGTLADVQRLARDDPDEAPPRVTVALTGELDGLDPIVAAAVYRIAQEAVTNALRHAREVTRVDVEVHGCADGVRLSVRDDGEAVTSLRDTTGFGIAGMAERAALLGGALYAGRGQHGGWLVEASLPRHGAGR